MEVGLRRTFRTLSVYTVLGTRGLASGVSSVKVSRYMEVGLGRMSRTLSVYVVMDTRELASEISLGKTSRMWLIYTVLGTKIKNILIF